MLVKLAVEPGTSVSQGAELFVVEAMKMEYVVRAPRAVTIGTVAFSQGDAVEQGDIVCTFEEGA